MPILHGPITLHLGPNHVGAPDDLEAPIVAFIDGATRWLDVAVQEIDHPPIAEALVRARLRGVRVKVVLEHDYIAEPKPVSDPLKSGAHGLNRALASDMLRASIDVKSDFNTDIFHQKFIVRDRSALLTGSTNFTTTGVRSNLNHLVIVEDEAVAKAYWREFRDISKGRFGREGVLHARRPAEIDVAGVRVKPLFAPEHAPEMEIMKLMAKARERVDFAMFTFAASSGIDDQMIATRARGLPVRGALDRKQANQKWAATKGLAAAGCDLFLPKRRGSGIRKIHHKLMVLDDQVIVAGSFNYTGPANLLNDENIIVIGDFGADAVTEARQRALAAPVREEIDRIIAEHCDPLS